MDIFIGFILIYTFYILHQLSYVIRDLGHHYLMNEQKKLKIVFFR